MSKKAKNKSKLPKVLKVSGRDQEIYQQTAIEGQSQRKVAAERHISQSRVSKIVQRVELWLGETVPFGFAELPREQRLYMAQRKHRLKLDWMYHQATAAWQESKLTLNTVKEKVVKGEKIVETIRKTQVGNFRLLDEACKIAEKQIVFEGFALDGQVEVSCKGRLFELPAMTDAEMAAALKLDHDLLYPIALQWEAEQAERARMEAEDDEGVSGREGDCAYDNFITCTRPFADKNFAPASITGLIDDPDANPESQATHGAQWSAHLSG